MFLAAANVDVSDDRRRTVRRILNTGRVKEQVSDDYLVRLFIYFL